MNDEIIEILLEADEPFLTLGEIADKLGKSKGAVYNRLQELVNEEKIHRKEVGARAVIWWHPDRYESPDELN